MLLTTSQVAERLGCSTKTVYRFIDDGLLVAVRVRGWGRALRFEPAEVDRFLAERNVSARPDEAAS